MNSNKLTFCKILTNTNLFGKMKIYLWLITLLIVFAVASRAEAQILWNQSESGMTPKQVQTIIPNVVSTTEPKMLPDGSVSSLRRDGLYLVDNIFSAYFYFKVEKLTQVILFLAEPLSYDRIIDVFDNTREALNKKYGEEEFYNEEHVEGIFIKFYAFWSVAGTDIALEMISFDESAAELSVSYQASPHIGTDQP